MAIQTIFKDIRQAIIDKINSDDITKIQVAYKTDRSNFEGAPAAVVSPSDNEADWDTTATDRVIAVFKVKIYYPIPDQTKQEASELAIEEAVDEMLTVFRNRSILGDAADWVAPIAGAWEYEERGDGIYRVATLTLRCTKIVEQQ